MWRRTHRRRPPNAFIALMFNKAVILSAVALVGAYAFKTEIPNFPSWHVLVDDMEIAADCETRSAIEPAESCVERRMRIQARPLMGVYVKPGSAS
ncbi:hypothetical protein ABIA23_006874 [Sinorhizobium fredii]